MTNSEVNEPPDKPTSENDLPDEAKSGRNLKSGLRERMQFIGGALASIAAVGTVAGGLIGYWSVWKTLRTDVFSGKSKDTGYGPARHRSPVCTENLSPTIVVMKSAKDGARTNDTGALYRARDGRILVQRAMRSDAVVVMGIRFQNPTQMGLAQDNDVVQTLTPD